MTKSAQPRRRVYDSSSRRARAADGRRRILRCAHELFIARGYAATTMADIATAAGVSPPTVYATGTKATLLKACVDVALAGDDEQMSVADRPLAQWVYDSDDARVVLARYAEMMGVLAARAAPIYDVLVRAADAEQELADVLADFERQRLRAATMVAEAIAARGGIPPGRSVTEARDTVWVLNAPELYVSLTRRRRWSTRRYVDWARTALLQLVVAPLPPDPPPTRKN